MNVIKENKNAVDVVIKHLKNGDLTFMATDTVYIAAVDATNKNAVEKLVAFKNRPFGKPFSVGVTDIKMAEKYVVLNDAAKSLYKEFLPGPLTVVSTGKHIVAPGVEAENGTLGIRIPDYKFFLDVSIKFGRPITTTSANASYQKRPYNLSDILDNISSKQKGLIGLMVDAGTLPLNEPSTVIDTTLDDLVILRQGDLKIKDEAEIFSKSTENTQNIGKELWQKYEKYHGKRPIVFALEGPMGAGKTQFTKGLGRAMGIKDEIISPTYSLEEEYDNGKLYHFDTWRMYSPDELVQIGFNDILRNSNAVVSIEWAEKVISILREHSEDTIIVWIKIKYGQKDDERLISWGTL